MIPDQVLVLVNPVWIVTGDAANKTGNRKPVGVAARFLDQECLECLFDQGLF